MNTLIENTKNYEQLVHFLGFLHREGNWSYWWTDRGLSLWWPVNNPQPIPTDWLNVYFGVHPTTEIPKFNSKGDSRPQEFVRSQNLYIASVNCLFSEFDAKDFQGSSPDDCKDAALNHIGCLDKQPSVIIDSGGGYHCYWLLKDPYTLTTQIERERACRIQAGWVEYTGGDEGAKDLARMLRVPGSRNYKPIYKPPRLVSFFRFNNEIQYELTELENLILNISRPVQITPPVIINQHTYGFVNDNKEQISNALNALAKWRCDDYAEWIRVGFSLKAGLGESGLDMWDTWSRGSEKYKSGECEKRWHGLNPSKIHISTLFFMADEDDPDWRRNSNGIKGKNEGQLPILQSGEISYVQPQFTKELKFSESENIVLQSQTPKKDSTDPFWQFTDLGNAHRFSEDHKGELCFTDGRGWMVWNGKNWEIDTTYRVLDNAKKTIVKIFRQAKVLLSETLQEIDKLTKADQNRDEEAITKALEMMKLANAFMKWAYKSQERSRVDAMIALSKDRLATRDEEFDMHPYLLNVQNGILDLKNGILYQHNPEKKITKIAATYYDPNANCPTWLKFLSRIFNDNQELIEFIRRAVGASLSGVNIQAFFILIGIGANGKSTFTNAIQEMIGNYAIKLRSETFMVKRNDSIPEEIAQLDGKRFAVASELADGQKLNESLIKDLTGGDSMRARFLYKNSFQFRLHAKIWLYGNHRPNIVGTDEGIWRRPKMINFDVIIPEAERDALLPYKLQQEFAGILTWAVQGCFEWQRLGLAPPQEVLAVTTEFRMESDSLGSFIEDCLTKKDQANITAGELYETFIIWCEERGEKYVQSNIRFSKQMRERGYSVVLETSGKNVGKPARNNKGHNFYADLELTEMGKEYLSRYKFRKASK